MPKRRTGSKITITVYEVDRVLWDKFRAESIMKELKYGELLNRILDHYFKADGKYGNYSKTVQRHYDGDDDGCWLDSYGTLRKIDQ